MPPRRSKRLSGKLAAAAPAPTSPASKKTKKRRKSTATGSDMNTAPGPKKLKAATNVTPKAEPQKAPVNKPKNNTVITKEGKKLIDAIVTVQRHPDDANAKALAVEAAKNIITRANNRNRNNASTSRKKTRAWFPSLGPGTRELITQLARIPLICTRKTTWVGLGVACALKYLEHKQLVDNVIKSLWKTEDVQQLFFAVARSQVRVGWNMLANFRAGYASHTNNAAPHPLDGLIIRQP